MKFPKKLYVVKDGGYFIAHENILNATLKDRLEFIATYELKTLEEVGLGVTIRRPKKDR